MSKINEAIDALNKIKEEMKAKSAEALTIVMKDFFENYPQVKTIYFTGYTPYFSDGDECIYSLSEINFSPVEWQEVDGPYFGDEQEEPEKWDFSPYKDCNQDDRVTPKMEEDMQSLISFFNTIEDHIQQSLGDHSFFRFHKDGVEIEEYDHE